MVMMVQSMETVDLGPRIAGTTAAVYNKMYKQYTMFDIERRIKLIQNVRYKCGLDIPHRDRIIFKPIRGRTVGTHFDNTGKIFIDPRRTTFEVISTVAHELIHEEQTNKGYLTKEFINGEWVRMWKGKRYRAPKNHAEYLALPWEKDAFERQNDLASKAIAMLFS